jgi:hypothetical protein
MFTESALHYRIASLTTAASSRPVALPAGDNSIRASTPAVGS